MSKLWTSFTAALALCLSAPTTTAQQTAIAPAQPLDIVPAPSDAEGAHGLMVDAMAAREAGISPHVLDLALTATACGIASGDFDQPPTLTVIDYARPSVEPRLWVFDLATGGLLFTELVAHGQATGENMALHFSDRPNSRQTSIGLFVTGETYVGRNGYSLRMDGLEPGFNSHARERAIVMHGAPYVSREFASEHGRLGRSWGCPAVREAVAREVIDTVRGGGVVFSYYPDEEWLEQSRFLNCDPPGRLAAGPSTRPAVPTAYTGRS